MLENEFSDLLTIKEVEKYLKLGHTKVHQLLASGEIASLKIGKSRRVRRTDLDRFLEALITEENG